MLRSVAIRVLHPRLKVDRTKLETLIITLDAEARRFQGGCPSGELSLAFLSDRALARIHGAYLADPTATDVITFDGYEELGQAGEICVSVDTAERYAAEQGLGFSAELSLYVVHGWLHLAGYDDLEPRRKRTMRSAEARALEVLRQKKLLGAFALTKAKRSGAPNKRGLLARGQAE